jgi:catechol-2,3-dioxygenase
MLTQGFAELTIEVRDREALERCYRELFGLRVLARADDRVWLAAGEHARLGQWLPGEKEFGDEGGDRSLYAEDLEGNVVEVWDFFARGEGRRDGAAALARDDVRQVDTSS